MAPTPSWCGTENGETFVQFIVVYTIGVTPTTLRLLRPAYTTAAGYIWIALEFQKYKEVHDDASAMAVIIDFKS